jgi:hypothetical protein
MGGPLGGAEGERLGAVSLSQVGESRPLELSKRLAGVRTQSESGGRSGLAESASVIRDASSPLPAWKRTPRNVEDSAQLTYDFHSISVASYVVDPTFSKESAVPASCQR